MATPEDLAFQTEDISELRLIPGGLAVEQTVEVSPVIPVSFEEFSQALDEPNWANMSATELLAIRESLSGYTGELAVLMHHMQQQYDAAHLKKIQINGYIRDRL